MNLSIRFTRPTLKLLIQHLKQAYGLGDLRSVRRISALLALAQGDTVDQVAETLSMSRQTIYNWLKAFILYGVDSLVCHRSPGRESRLTKTQKKRLLQLIKAGPLEAGYLTACWSWLLVQHLILREFGVLYSRHYVCELLRNLGFSFCQFSPDMGPPVFGQDGPLAEMAQGRLLLNVALRAWCAPPLPGEEVCGS